MQLEAEKAARQHFYSDRGVIMSILLTFPPKGDLGMPFLSMPALAGYLRSNGFRDVRTRDLNIEFADWITQPAQLKQGADELSAVQRLIDGGTMSGVDIEKHRTRLQILEQIAPQVVEECQAAKAVCRGQRGRVSIAEHAHACGLLLKAFELGMVPYFPGWLDGDALRIGVYSHTHSSDLIAAIADERGNPFITFLQERFLSQLTADPPDLVGISIPYVEQLLCGLTLARMIRESLPQSRIVFGGSLITRMARRLAKIEPLAPLADGFVVRDGEEALLALAKWSCGEGRKEDAPNLVYREAGQVRETEHKLFTEMTSLPTPDFSGMPLEDYFSPVTIFPLQYARGCYWNRCAFCDCALNKGNRFRPRGADAVVRDVLTLKKLHNARAFSLIDDSVPPAGLRRLAEQFLEQKVDATWGTCARMEPSLNEALCTRAYEAGCRVLWLGFESGSQRVLDLMNKGTNIQEMHAVLDACHAAGIQPYLMFMLGFPGSREEDEQQTVDFVLRYARAGDALAFGTFQLYEEAPVMRDPARFGICDTHRDEEDDLSCLVPYYRVEDGISPERAAILDKELREGVFRPFLEHWDADPFLQRLRPLVVEMAFSDARAVASAATPSAEQLWGSSLVANKNVIFGDATYQRIEQLQEHLGEEEGSSSWIFNKHTCRAVTLSRGGAVLLHLCDGRSGEKVLAAFAEIAGFSDDSEIEELRENVFILLERLLSCGLVSIARSAGDVSSKAPRQPAGVPEV